MVGAVVAELHLQGLRAAGQPQQLVAEADAEGGMPSSQQFADRLDRVVAGLGIARAVGQEHAVRLQRQHFLGRRLRRHHGQPAAALGQHAQDVALDAEVVGDDVELRRRSASLIAARPAAHSPSFQCVRLVAAHHLGQVHARQPGKAARLLRAPAPRRLSPAIEAAVLRAFFAQDARQLARVDVGDRHDVAGS